GRRALAKAGLRGTTGLPLPELLPEEEGADYRRPTGGQDGLILGVRGGPSHIDMWDPRPDAPVEYRGEYGVQRTCVNGISLSDMLPRCGRIMDKWSIIRSLHHNDAGHSSGDQICFTGYPAGPNPDENVYPACGAVVS